MQITKILPTGFCFGVKRSIEETLKVIDSTSKKVYMLGWLVHNESVIKELKEKGVIIIDDSNKSRNEIAKELDYSNDNDIMICSAHGTGKDVKKILNDKNYDVIDLVCPFVKKTHLIINQSLKENKEIIFIGKHNHPETNAIMAIDTKINLVTNMNEAKDLIINQEKKYFCTNQTTLSIFEIQSIINYLKQNIKHLEFENDICDATTKRQQALYGVDNSVDVILVIGHKKSSNANELLKIALTKTNDSYLIEGYQDINLDWFKNKQNCAIISAASCGEKLVDETISFLKENIND